jgi:hypothetical protein
MTLSRLSKRHFTLCACTRHSSDRLISTPSAPKIPRITARKNNPQRKELVDRMDAWFNPACITQTVADADSQFGWWENNPIFRTESARQFDVSFASLQASNSRAALQERKSSWHLWTLERGRQIADVT